MVSLAFWLCLLTAGGLYALVVLSPKAVRWSRRAEEYAANQQQLLNLQRQIDYGDRLTSEFASNAEFRSFVVSGDSQGENVIPVEEALRYRMQPIAPARGNATGQTRRLQAILQAVAGSRWLQVAGLLCAALLLVFAFTTMMEKLAPFRGLARGRGRLQGRGRFRILPNRYNFQSPPAATAERRSDATKTL